MKKRGVEKRGAARANSARDGGGQGERRLGVRRILSWGVGLVCLVTLTAAIVIVTLYYGEIRDYVAGIGYEPTAEMVRLRDELSLTERARLIFDASWPELNERGDFNRNCRAGEGDMAILGCYAGERIYVYDIVNEELTGVREAAIAHELLHAVWARLSVRERDELLDELLGVLAENEWLSEELLIYEEEARDEELYVRAGVEVRDLPAELEEYYAGVFARREAVVEYYEGYIAVFRGIEERLEEIGAELGETEAKLDAAVADYEKRIAQWSADVVSFNACAAVEGCFASEVAFNSRRAGLVSEQGKLLVLYDEISELVEQMNELVAEYNANVIHGQMLNDAVNSLAVPEGV